MGFVLLVRFEFCFVFVDKPFLKNAFSGFDCSFFVVFFRVFLGFGFGRGFRAFASFYGTFLVSFWMILDHRTMGVDHFFYL